MRIRISILAPFRLVILILGGGDDANSDYKSKATVLNDNECTINDMLRGSYWSAGALLDKRPVYCGGKDFTTSSYTYSHCYQLQVDGEWSEFGSLMRERYRHSAVALNNDMIWFSGGILAGAIKPTDSTELFHADGTATAGPELPNRIMGHCMVKTENGMIYSTGGEITGAIALAATRLVWIFQEDLSFLSYGPEFNVARSYHGCNVVTSNNHDGRQVLLIAGGENGENSAEILDFMIGGSIWISCKFCKVFFEI